MCSKRITLGTRSRENNHSSSECRPMESQVNRVKFGCSCSRRWMDWPMARGNGGTVSLRQPEVSVLVEYDLDKPRIAPYIHSWRSHHKTVFWCNLMLVQRKGLRFYQSRSHPIALSDTLPAICIDQPLQSRIKGFDYWKWTATKSSSSTRHLRRDNVQIAPPIGKLVSSTAHAENACSHRKEIDSWTKTDLTHCRFLDT